MGTSEKVGSRALLSVEKVNKAETAQVYFRNDVHTCRYMFYGRSPHRTKCARFSLMTQKCLRVDILDGFFGLVRGTEICTVHCAIIDDVMATLYCTVIGGRTRVTLGMINLASGQYAVHNNSG
jgi:hypothetical protein